MTDETKKEFLTLQEASEELGIKVPTLYQIMREGKIAYYQFVRRKIRRRDLDAYIETLRVPVEGNV